MTPLPDHLPPLQFPDELPISSHREAIQEALARHPVTIVCGDTGSGKTTQLPKMALQLGRGAGGRLIGCTQPRRLAALAMARRVAEELGQEPGGLVGYQHRFDRRTSERTVIKFMTDGILLAETRHDRLLAAYDTVIVDEAHERSLNIDFLLGLIKSILPRRPDLRIVISSATLDAARFSAFFGGAPVLTIPGRLHPIEVRYRPPEEDDADLPRMVADAVDALEGAAGGDILAFLPGERDIRETAEVLTGRRLPATEIIPLLASLPPGEQQRAFRTSTNRRIILATNVAETSVTLPGIRTVIDSGLARISRYNHRTQVQRLHVEPISQASANQRAGRCGRLGPGICVRLYSEEDFAGRDAYTDPEILRSSLAGVILAMLELRLGDIATFPFLEPPAPAAIREGYRELQELGAITATESGPPRLTSVGWRLAAMPVEPRLGRMLLAAHAESVLADALIVVAGLEGDDPRRRPIANQAEADQAHARFHTPASDFAAMLRLWRWWEAETAGQPQSVGRRLCRDHFLSYPKMREWRDVRDQLAALCRRLDLDPTSASGDDAALHRSLLSGLLNRIGQRDPQAHDYRGCRGIRFSIFPGSGLFRKQPGWVMAGELVETSRLYARSAAAIDPRWIEPLAGPLCKRSHHSPCWDAETGHVRATERVTLHGLVIVEGRRCDYGRVNPAASREIFIRHGLVAGAFPRPPPVIRDNIALLEHARRTEQKARRTGQWIDEERLVAFFDSRLPPSVHSADGLRRWLAEPVPGRVEALRLSPEDVLPGGDAAAGFPDALVVGGRSFPLTYVHDPGGDADGITCTVPASELPALSAWRPEWLVPGALPDKVRWMLGALPFKLRRTIEPLDETVSRCLSRLTPGRRPLAESLADALQAVKGVGVPPGIWLESELPAHLRMRFVVTDVDGRTAAAGRDLPALFEQFGATAGAMPASDSRGAHSGLTAWTCGDLPEQVEAGSAGWTIVNYPALVDAGDHVDLRLLADPAASRAAHAGGVTRLFALALGKDWKVLTRPPSLPRPAAAFLRQLETNETRLGQEIGLGTLHAVLVDNQPAVRHEAAFRQRLLQGRPALGRAHAELSRLVTAVICDVAERSSWLSRATGIAAESADDLQVQLAWLVFAGFAATVPLTRLQHYPRYLEAVKLRIERAKLNPAADLRRLNELLPLWSRYTEFVAAPVRPRHDAVALAEYRWMVEEWRVSLFAQELRTPQPVSAKRLEAQWQRVLGS